MSNARKKEPVRRATFARFVTCICTILAFAPSAFSEWVERPDAMHWHQVADVDQQDGRVRILYHTYPALQQAVQPGWSANAYLAELHLDGHIENRRLATGQRKFNTLLLQRNGDGVFAFIAPGKGERGQTLEYWSAADGTVRSATHLPEFDESSNQVFSTDDGNLFVVSQSNLSSRGDQPNTLVLTKMSPEGSVLATGNWSNPTAIVGMTGAFAVPGGGMGVSVRLSLVKGAQALSTDIEPIQRYEIEGRTLEARVFSETRLLAADAAGNVLWQSPALEREVSWQGELAIPQGQPIEQMMSQTNRQMALMERVALDNGGHGALKMRGYDGLHDIRKTPSGYGTLTRVSADQSLQPPRHGDWFIEMGDNGKLLRELRIEPAARQLDAKFETFAPTADGGLLVAGPREGNGGRLHVTALDRDGGIEWTVRLAQEIGQIAGVAGSKSAPWVFGEAFSDAGNKNLLWVEQVNPDRAERPAAPTVSASETVQPSPEEMAQAIPSMNFEMPEPAEGCSCSCEEFAKVQEISEKMKSAAQADVMAMLSDPDFQALTNCMAGCAMKYAACQ